MIINGTSFVPGYINHEGEVVPGGNEHHSGIISHRRQTRQRHLSSGADEDIASSYFAAQYGNQQQQKQASKQGSKQTSKSNSRRNSLIAGSSNSNVNQVMANAAALIAAKKQKEREEAMRREAEHKRQLQQREMTPDNLRVVEQKLIEFQKQQQSEEETQLSNGYSEHINGQMQNVEHQMSVVNQQMEVKTQKQESYENHVTHYQQTQSMTEQQQSYEQQSTMMQQQSTIMQQQSSMMQQQQQSTIMQQQQQSSMLQQQQHQLIQEQQTQSVTHQQQQSFEQSSHVMQQQQSYQQQNQIHHQQSNQQSLQHEQFYYSSNPTSIENQNNLSSIQQSQNMNGCGSGRGSMPRDVRGSSEMTYMSLLPEDGSMPHRTNPIGDPITKRSQSVAATPDREIKRKWSISSSTDYLNKTNKGSYMARNNPIGLAEPSVKRDGYAVGSREGSMYRSTGNVNVSRGTVGSRAASEAKDIPTGNWQGRRASTSDIKGSGIRVGGNLVEPSTKPNMCMPFGSANKSGGYMKRRVNKTVQQSSQSSSSQETHTAQQITESKLKAKRERNRTISGETTTQTSSKTLTQQVGTALSGITTALEKIQVNESKQNVTMPLPRKSRRAQSLPRGQVSNEESSFKVSLPGSARTSRQASVEPDQNRKKLSRHGSVEIFDGAYNLTVPNKLSRHASTTKLEEVHTDHIKITGESEDDVTNSKSEKVQETTNKSVDVKSTEGKTKGFSSDSVTLNNQIIESPKQKANSDQHVSNVSESSSYHQSTSVQQSTDIQQSSLLQQSQSFKQTSTVQESVSVKQSSTTEQQTIVQNQTQQQQSMIKSAQVENQTSQTISQSQRSRQASGSNDTVVSGNRFNISNGLKRQSHHASQEEVRRSRHVSGTVEHGVGSALKGLDTALNQIAAQQKKEETQYVAKVTSRQTSRRGSISVSTDSNDVTNVMVSLPASKNASRATSRRNSVDLSAGGGRGRRGSLDIYTAEYAVKIGNKKNITNMEQKTTFHMKVDNKDETDLNLCGRCHLPTHKTAKCTDFGENSCPRCLSWDHWEESCWMHEDGQMPVCERCDYEGHTPEVHETDKYTQRRACVDALGWEPFQDWFYDQQFRTWWQVMGGVGVPLYRIYQRKTEWKTEKPEPKEEEDRYIARDDSVDDMIAQVLKQRTVRTAAPQEENDSSGRSTPAHLKNIKINLPSDDEDDDSSLKKPIKKNRTFSETLKMLDADILADLDEK